MDNRTRYIVFAKRLYRKIATFLFTKDAAVFLLFFIVAFMFWFMHGTGARRELKLKAAVTYTGIPNNIRLESQLPNTVSFLLKDEGKELWTYYRSADFDTVVIDLSSAFDGNGLLNLQMDNYLSILNTRLAKTTQIVDIMPATIHSRYTVLSQKQLPFVLSGDMPVARQYVMSDSITIYPKMVTAFAEQNILDTLDSVFLELPKSEISSSGRLQLKPKPYYDGIVFQPAVADVWANVELSTEKTISLPVSVENLPDGVTFKAFPSVVSVKFIVGISRFNSIDVSDFSVSVDYNSLVADKDGRIRVKVTKVPDCVYNVSLSPSLIEFILEEDI